MGWLRTWLDLMHSIPSSSFQVSLNSFDLFKCTFWAWTDKRTDRQTHTHTHKAKPIHPHVAGCKNIALQSTPGFFGTLCIKASIYDAVLTNSMSHFLITNLSISVSRQF